MLGRCVKASTTGTTSSTKDTYCEAGSQPCHNHEEHNDYPGMVGGGARYVGKYFSGFQRCKHTATLISRRPVSSGSYLRRLVLMSHTGRANPDGTAGAGGNTGGTSRGASRDA